MPSDNYIPISEAARRLGVSRQTVFGWCQKGQLTHIRLPVGDRVRYFIDLAEFEKRLNDARVESKEPAPRLPGRPNRLNAINGGR